MHFSMKRRVKDLHDNSQNFDTGGWNRQRTQNVGQEDISTRNELGEQSLADVVDT
jgi:hypothetical protein